MEKKKTVYIWRTVASFLLVLFAMPLGHALMILMEKFMSEGAMHVAGFMMGLAGLVMVVVGVFVKGDTRQTLWGFFGGLLFWTGWVEFLFLYYAQTLWRSARNRERRGGDEARIPYHACLVWLVDDGYDHVCVQHEEWLRPDNMDTEGMPPQQAQGSGSATHDAAHEHRNVYGDKHDTLGNVLAAHVLLRQDFPRRPPSRNVLCGSGMPRWVNLHAAPPTAHSRMGREHTNGYRHSHHLLDSCGNLGKDELFPRVLGKARGTHMANACHTHGVSLVGCLSLAKGQTTKEC